ncbi:hypothetical protein [Tsukamurella sp. NPDC003166]|uniref:hypothetical protein n=1 Tax=Tsukamurella sp. NPDC003166 TaxID=3154444 RepID=UPI0033AF04CE
MSFKLLATAVTSLAVLPIGAAVLGGGAAQAAPTCGTVTYPRTGTVGVIEVRSGSVSCAEARKVIDRYLHDKTLVGQGNTDSKRFDGWLCASPTAVAAQEYGYSTGCSRELPAARVVVVPR